MQVKILQEAGYEHALRGMAYSYKDPALDPDEWWAGQFEKAEKRAKILAHKDGGHNGFLESIHVWIDIQACRAWWSEMDRYRVGKTQQSESTMHTLSKRAPELGDFEEGTSEELVARFRVIWQQSKGDINVLKMNLPEGFLQRRVVNTNYKTLRNVLWQREGHRLKWWGVFRDAVLAQVEHPEFLIAEA